jgi:hypothetical protein
MLLQLLHTWHIVIHNSISMPAPDVQSTRYERYNTSRTYLNGVEIHAIPNIFVYSRIHHMCVASNKYVGVGEYPIRSLGILCHLLSTACFLYY